MTEIDTLEAEWHEWRRGGIGGSDIAALLGLSRYASPTSLYYEKIGALEPSETTQRQRIGKRMEAVLAAEFSDETGLYVAGEQTWCSHSTYPWARCTVDGFVADSPYGGASADTALGTWQAKTDGRFGWPDGIPSSILAQCYWEMGVNQVEHCWLTVMFAGFHIETHEIAWDDDAQSDWELMLEAAGNFWRNHVLRKVPPPPDDSQVTTDTLTYIAGSDPEGMLDADEQARTLVAMYRSAKERTKIAEADEGRLGNELRQLLGEHTELIDGWTTPAKGPAKPKVLASWRTQTLRRLDVTALRDAMPDIADKYTTETQSRVLRLH